MRHGGNKHEDAYLLRTNPIYICKYMQTNDPLSKWLCYCKARSRWRRNDRETSGKKETPLYYRTGKENRESGTVEDWKETNKRITYKENNHFEESIEKIPHTETDIQLDIAKNKGIRSFHKMGPIFMGLYKGNIFSLLRSKISLVQFMRPYLSSLWTVSTFWS